MRFQHKPRYWRQEQRPYLQSYYKRFGIKIYPIENPNKVNYAAGVVSALLGCALMFVVFTIFDLGPVLGSFYSTWDHALNDVFAMLSSNITG